MADLATPSAATMSTIDAGAQKPAFTKPERPDQAEYDKTLAEAQKALDAAVERQASCNLLKSIKAKLDSRPNNKESPEAKRQQELRARLNEIREAQKSGKSSRAQQLGQIQRLDEQLKSRMNEQKTARSRVAFRSVDEIQNEINRLQAQVETGTMKIVDEKKNLAEITALNKQKKGFAGFEQAQKQIDDIKAQIAEIKKSMDDPASKALSDEYTKITTELDEIKAKQDEVFKNLNQLRDERTRANEAQQVAYTNLKDIKDKYWQAKRAYAEYEKEAYRVRRERQKAERDAYEAGKRKQVAEAKLEEASAPAYGDEIQTAQSLIRYFDPSSQEAKAAAGPGKFAAQASRTVEATGIKGTALPRKGEADEDYMAGNGGKKGKKNRKNQNASPAPEAAATKFNLSFGVIEQLAKIDVQPPSSQAAVAGVVEQIKAKLEGWQKDQARKTQENIDKAKKEIERLEAESSENGANTNGKSADGVAADLEKTKLDETSS
ncbi:hypothetical protein KCU99_g2497, partial [Aureobasidium melanogenum]